jgi:hypothetical protein
MKTLLFAATAVVLCTGAAIAGDCVAIPGTNLWKCDVPPSAPQCVLMEGHLICNSNVPVAPAPQPGNCSFGKKGYVCK